MLNGLIMKKIGSIILLLASIAYAQTEASYKLTPELDEFMTLQPISEQYFEHNAYIGWMGLTYPKNDWLIAYRDIFKANDAMLNQRVNDGRLLTNYFANPRQAIFQLSNDKTMLNDLFGPDDGLIELQDHLHEQKLLSFRQSTLGNKRYRYTKDFFVCADYLDANCLEKMLERRQYIEETIRNNQQLLDRFKTLVETSQYNYALFHNDFNASINTAPNTGMMKLIQLYLTDSIMKIVDGDIDQGLDQLVIVRQWIDLMFHEKSKASLLHFFVNISVTQFLDQTMNVLLDSGLLNSVLDDERIAFIVMPYSDHIGKKLNEVVLFEMKQNFKDFAYPYLKIYTLTNHELVLTEEDEFIILACLRNFGVILSPALDEIYKARSLAARTKDWPKLKSLQKATQSINKIWFNVVHEAKEVQPRIMDAEGELELLRSSHEHFVEILTDWYQQYFQELGISPKEALFAFNEKYPSIHFYNDYYKMLQIISLEENLEQRLSPKTLYALLNGQIMPETLAFVQTLSIYSDFDNYWVRLYEQQNYHQLVYLKFLIMKDQISEENLSEFLSLMGSLARNTMTNKSYVYDEESSKLSTPLPRQNKYVPVHIKILRLYDASIQNFEVILPKY